MYWLNLRSCTPSILSKIWVELKLGIFGFIQVSFGLWVYSHGIQVGLETLSNSTLPSCTLSNEGIVILIIILLTWYKKFNFTAYFHFWFSFAIYIREEFSLLAWTPGAIDHNRTRAGKRGSEQQRWSLHENRRARLCQEVTRIWARDLLWRAEVG